MYLFFFFFLHEMDKTDVAYKNEGKMNKYLKHKRATVIFLSSDLRILIIILNCNFAYFRFVMLQGR